MVDTYSNWYFAHELFPSSSKNSVGQRSPPPPQVYATWHQGPFRSHVPAHCFAPPSPRYFRQAELTTLGLHLPTGRRSHAMPVCTRRRLFRTIGSLPVIFVTVLVGKQPISVMLSPRSLNFCSPQHGPIMHM